MWNALRQLGIQSLAFVAIGLLVYAVTRALRFRYRGWSFANARASAPG
jgi:hypothetical protein